MTEHRDGLLAEVAILRKENRLLKEKLVEVLEWMKADLPEEYRGLMVPAVDQVKREFGL
jgi:hypothetical protein